MRRILAAAILAAMAAAPGCRIFRREGKVQAPVRVMQPPPEAKQEPKEVPEAPQLPPEQVELEAQTPLPGEPLPAPPRRRRARVQQPQPAQQAEEPAVAEQQPQPPAPPAIVPQLTQVLTPEQQSAYNAAVDRNLDRARRTVTALSGRKLNRNQAIYLERIKSFIQQAADARSTDLVRAVNLSERASLLADDLLKSF